MLEHRFKFGLGFFRAHKQQEESVERLNMSSKRGKQGGGKKHFSSKIQLSISIGEEQFHIHGWKSCLPSLTFSSTKFPSSYFASSTQKSTGIECKFGALLFRSELKSLLIARAYIRCCSTLTSSRVALELFFCFSGAATITSREDRRNFSSARLTRLRAETFLLC